MTNKTSESVHRCSEDNVKSPNVIKKIVVLRATSDIDNEDIDLKDGANLTLVTFQLNFWFGILKEHKK